MKTGLSIVQATAKRMNVNAPAALYNVTDTAVLQLVELLYAVCEELRQARCWTVQKRTYTFTTAANRRLYPLPADFYAPLLGTHYDTSSDLELDGPLADSDVQYRLVRADGGHPYGYRLFGPDILSTTAGQFQFDQVLPADTVIAFEYLTGSFFVPASWNGADTTLREALGADTDLCIFDSDLVKLGLRAKYMEDNGGDYGQAKAEFEGKIDAATARFNGSHIGSMAGPRPRRRYQGDKIGGWSF
jgi:hypothetical protein